MKLGSTLSPKYQVSIPKAVREQLAWKPGQKLVFIPQGNGVLMMPAPDREDLVGLARGVKIEGYRDRNDRY
jgi:AbrB family looped-hinge helix DNA binding protein